VLRAESTVYYWFGMKGDLGEHGMVMRQMRIGEDTPSLTKGANVRKGGRGGGANRQSDVLRWLP
jgi:hypothetical protein